MAKKRGYYNTTSVFDEAIRSVRTNIQFSDIDNKKVAKPKKKLF